MGLGRGAPARLTSALSAQGEECPIVPGVEQEDWPLPDPKGKNIAQVRVIREEITARIRKLIEQKAVRR